MTHTRAAALIASICFVIDQLTKHYASYLSATVMVHTAPKLHSLIIIPSFLLTWYIIKRKNKLQTVAAALLFGGVLSNATDVALFAGAVDWLGIGIMEANLADFFALSGLILYVASIAIELSTKHGILKSATGFMVAIICSVSIATVSQMSIHPSTENDVRNVDSRGR